MNRSGRLAADLRVDEVGERRLIQELFAPRYRDSGAGRFGDDCAVVWPATSGSATIVATIDPCPPPAARALGFYNLRSHGWLAATISLSDLAAAGSIPLGLLVSLVIPPDLRVGDLEELLGGLDDCAAEAATSVVGGNIKEGPALDITVTGFGSVEGVPLSHIGLKAGHVIVAIGTLGRFWAQFLVHRRFGGSDPESVLYPTAQVAAGQVLSAHSGVRCCIDASDGLWPAALELASTNRVGITFDFSTVRWTQEVSEAATRLEVDPRRLALGWGDWTLLTACASEDLASLQNSLAAIGATSSVVGSARAGDGIMIRDDDQERTMARVDSERLTRDSWMTVGLDSYIDHLLTTSLSV